MRKWAGSQCSGRSFAVPGYIYSTRDLRRILIHRRIGGHVGKYSMQRVQGVRSLGASLVLADWQVRVFGSSGLIDRTSDHLYVQTINLHGCMYGFYHYKPTSHHIALLATNIQVQHQSN